MGWMGCALWVCVCNVSSAQATASSTSLHRPLPLYIHPKHSSLLASIPLLLLLLLLLALSPSSCFSPRNPMCTLFRQRQSSPAVACFKWPWAVPGSGTLLRSPLHPLDLSLFSVSTTPESLLLLLLLTSPRLPMRHSVESTQRAVSPFYHSRDLVPSPPDYTGREAVEKARYPSRKPASQARCWCCYEEALFRFYTTNARVVAATTTSQTGCQPARKSLSPTYKSQEKVQGRNRQEKYWWGVRNIGATAAAKTSQPAQDAYGRWQTNRCLGG